MTVRDQQYSLRADILNKMMSDEITVEGFTAFFNEFFVDPHTKLST